MTEAHCDPTVKDNKGWTPLHIACQFVLMMYTCMYVEGFTCVIRLNTHICSTVDAMILDNIHVCTYIHCVCIHTRSITLPLGKSWATSKVVLLSLAFVLVVMSLS